ncbi:metallophosphoesterase family protein [Chitinophaga caseinilytica]|uniref:Metallophosphoesterase family protein n=1 Tax=Chitinophaga caseinilytica TaxID=2267521 RepID=A0ABZ2Z376_9BACT
MKIALFSDIHANLPALEAFFADLDKRKPDAVYCLGDLVGYNIWPNEVIQAIRKRGIPTIAGNYDQGIGRMSNECGCAYKTTEDKDMGQISISYTNSLVGDDERKYLRTLPAHIRVEFQLNDDTLTLMLVHGSPRKINEYLFEDRDEKSMLRILTDANADILCFGHTHKPYHRIICTEPGEAPKCRHAINIGSVGKPKDGDPRGGYVMLHIDETLSIHDRNSLQVEFIRFGYDVEKAARAVETSILPNEYADMLRRGF